MSTGQVKIKNKILEQVIDAIKVIKGLAMK